MNTSCAPRYINLLCTHGTKLAQFMCARSLCCRGIVTSSTGFEICFPRSRVFDLVFVCIVNLFVKAKCTLAMYTLEMSHISPSFVPASQDVIYVQYGSTSYRVV